MKITNWLKRLDGWTDRKPSAALGLIAVIILVGILLALKLEILTGRQSNGSFLAGLLTGLLIGAALHVADLKRRQP